MTSEEDFQKALDENPEDSQTRLVFADWLDEHDDPRAGGYRALGVWRTHPRGPKSDTYDLDEKCFVNWFEWCMTKQEPYRKHHLPQVWRDKLKTYSQYKSRREAEEAAAMAWLELTDEQRVFLFNAGA
jgi:uncharacterized protein (TIGR02996 family)